MRIFIVSLLFCLVAEAGNYPRLFSQMGSPLYEASERFGELEGTASKEKIASYRKHTAKLLETGRDIESGRDVEKEELQGYFSALRELQKEHDALVSALRSELRSAIVKDDYVQVKMFSTSGVEAIFSQPSLQKLLVEYYQKQRHRGKIASLEKMAKELKEQPRHIASRGDANELVVLTTSWCPACKNAKAQLRAQGITFSEYDIERSSEGKRLYKKLGGHAIPMLIIGDDYRTGLDMGWVKERLK